MNVTMRWCAALAVLAAPSAGRAAGAMPVDRAPVYCENFDEVPVGNRLPPGVVDDSGWGGGHVPMQVVDSGDPRYGHVLQADVDGFAQIAIGDFDLRQGQSYRVSLDVASKGTQTITFVLREGPDPYEKHGETVEQTLESPRTVAFIATAGQHPEHARLQVVMRGTTTLTIDDVRVEPVTPEEARAATAGGDPLALLLPEPPVSPDNLLPNAGFELGSDGWYHEGPAEFADVGADAFEGHRVLRLGDGGVTLSGWLKLSLRRDYLIACRAKAVGGPAAVTLGFDDHIDMTTRLSGKARQFAVDPAEGWKRLAWTWRPPTPHGQVVPTRDYYVRIACRATPADDGVLVDAVDVRPVGEGFPAASDGDFAPHAPVELAVSTDAPANVATVGEPVAVRVAATGEPGPTGLVVADEDGHVQRTVPLTFANGIATVPVGDLQPGYWRLTTGPTAASGASGDRLDAEAYLTVAPVMPSDVPVAAWHFGTHVRPLPDMLAACRKLGWRWVRLHDVSSATKWPTVQPTADQWVFHDDEIAAYRAAGFALLGSLDRLPKWVPQRTTMPNGKPLPPSSHVELVSADDATLPPWREYCRRTAAHWAGQIDDWEVANEPNLRGLSPEQYAGLLEAAAAGVHEGCPQARVVALGGATPPNGPWLRRVIALGAARPCDALSFHAYGLTTWGSLGGPQRLRDTVDPLAAALAAAGSPTMPIDDSESGLILRSTFTRYYQPLGDSDPREAARMMPKAVAAVIASGLCRWYYYAAFETNSPGEGTGFRATDVNRTMRIPFQPMAVAIAMLEGRAFVGQDAVEQARGVIDLAFHGRGALVHLAWSTHGPADVAVPPRVSRALNMWGREVRLPADGAMQVDASPVYLVIDDVPTRT
jgi:hypothetical protein